MTRILGRIVVVLLAGAVVVLVTALGTGRIRYVSTHGVSMIPTYHDGELVVITRADHYRIGDIVAYTNPGDRVTVLHRIVGGDAAGWVIKGDNNQSIDVSHPRSDQVLGRAVAHVAGLGRVVASPLVLSVGGAAAALCVLGVVTLVTRRRPQASPHERLAHAASDDTVHPRPRRQGLWHKVALTGLDVVAVAAMAVALLFPVRSAPQPPPIEQRGTFRYDGAAPVSETYPDGRIATGDAVFTRLATRIRIHFAYSSDAASALTGHVRLELQLDNGSGWRHTAQMVGPTTIEGGTATASADLDLAEVQARAERVAEESGIAAATVNIVVRATVDVAAVGSPGVTTQFDLPLQLTARALSIADAGADPAAVQDTDDGPAFVVTHPLDAAPKETQTSGLVSDGQRRVAFFGLLGAVAISFALWPSAQTSSDLDAEPVVEHEPAPEPTTEPEPEPDESDASHAVRAAQPERRREPRVGQLTGSFPDGIACDGRSIWVANSGSNTVSRIDPVKGARTDHATGDRPRGIALDGTNVWVANTDSNTISRIHTGTGARTDFATGDGPQSVTHDGTHVWVTNSRSNTVSRIDPMTGAHTQHTVGLSPSGIAFDGWYVWVANFGSDTVTRLDPRQPAPGCGVHYSVGPNPMGVAFDGQHIWVANFGGDSVARIDPRDAAPGRAVHHQVGLNPRGLVWDGTSIWATNFSSGTVSKIAGGAEAGMAVTYATGSNPCGISSDGTSVWITNFTANTVSVIRTRELAASDGSGANGNHRVGS